MRKSCFAMTSGKAEGLLTLFALVGNHTSKVTNAGSCRDIISSMLQGGVPSTDTFANVQTVVYNQREAALPKAWERRQKNVDSPQCSLQLYAWAMR